MKIVDARVVVSSPGRNYVTLVIETEDGAGRPGRRHAQRARARGGVLPARPSVPVADRPGRPPDRGHLAVPLPGRLLAPRSGDHDRDRRRRRGLVGSQGQGRRAARLPVARRRGPRRGDGLLPRQRSTLGGARASTSSAISISATSRSGRRRRFRAWRRPTASRPTDGRIYEPASGNVPQEDTWETSAYLDFAPEVMAHVRAEFGYGVHLLHDVHHRLTPIEAARLGAGAGAAPDVLDRGSDPGRGSVRVPADPQHTTTPIAVGEVLEQHLGLPAADHRAADRLHPHLGVPRRRHHPPAPDLRARRPLRGAFRIARRPATSPRSPWPPPCTWI